MLPTLRLPDHLAIPLASGHPWLYRDALNIRHEPNDGAWVRVEAGRYAGIGLWAREGAIALRLFRVTQGSVAPPDAAWVRARVARALDQRHAAGLGDAENDAYRLLYGEGDGIPGLTVDRYGRYAVVKTYLSAYTLPGTEAATLHDQVIASLGRGLKLKGIVAAPSDAEGLVVRYGEAPPPELSVREHGLHFLANLHHGQKTGLFLDQRENRKTVRSYARGRRVANLFSYTGAFSIHALAGGATRAVDVDVAVGPLRDAERHAERNGVADRHATLALDLLSDPQAALRHADLAGSDLIVLDPPSLARHKGQRHGALRAYKRLNTAAMAALPDGGLLATASCTAQVGSDAFRAVLAEAALEAGVEARILHEAGHAADHPVPLAFPEGRYLKFLLLRIDRGG